MGALTRFRTHVIPDVLAYVVERGGDPAGVLARAGYPADAGRRSWIDAPIETLHRFFDEAAAAACDGNIGLVVGQRLSHATWDLIQVSCRASPTLGDALRRITQLIALFNDQVEIELEIDDASARMTHRVAGCAEGLSRHGNELWSTALLTRARAATGLAINPLEVWFGHARPSDVTPLVEAFGTERIGFGAGSSGMRFDAAILSLPLNGYDPVLLSVLDRLASTSIEQQGERRGVAAQVYREVRRHIEDGVPTLAKIAKGLGMSTRSLQRALETEAATYRDLVDQVRRDAARFMLMAGMAHADIALRLGYAETASLTRALSRWS